jgi:hypothetical protein
MAFDFCKIQNVEGRLCLIDAGRDHFNHGGLLEIYVIPEGDIIAFPAYNFTFDETGAAILEGSILLRPGVSAYRFRFSPDSAGFSEPMEESDDGIFYDQLLTMMIPKDRPEITHLKHKMRFARYTFLYKDSNGIIKVLRKCRVKFDLESGKSLPDYNGHTLQARRKSIKPALHFADNLTFEDLLDLAELRFDYFQQLFVEGWQSGKIIELPQRPASDHSLIIYYNNALKLRQGDHYQVNGRQIILNFNEEIPEGGDAADVQIFYAYFGTGSAVAAFHQESATKTASYSSGELITLSTAPADDQHLIIRYNNYLTLRLGIDYTLSGNDITLLMGNDPTALDPDAFTIYYLSDGAPLSVSGWQNFTHAAPAGLASGSTFNLPHTPITDSLLVHMDTGATLRPGVDFNILNDEITILFYAEPGALFDCFYAY